MMSTYSSPSNFEIVQTGHPALRAVCHPILRTDIGSEELGRFVDKLWNVLRTTGGVGLAAPQVAVNRCAMVVEDDPKNRSLPSEILAERQREPVDPYVLFNPVLEPAGPETARFFEGCLSIRKEVVVVERALSVRVRYMDTDGLDRDEIVSGWHARILQHEIDHLNGILITDRGLPGSTVPMESYTDRWMRAPSQEIEDFLQDGGSDGT